MIEPNLNQNFNLTPNTPPATFLKKPLLWIIIGVVILIVIALAFYVFPSLIKKSPIASEKDTAAKVLTPDINKILVEKAPQGKVIEGFLSGLIVDKDAVIRGSAENASNDPATRVFATSYDTKLSLAVVNQKYLDFFKKNDWVMGDNRIDKNSFSLFAHHAVQGSVNINFFENGETNLVVILFNKSIK
jgi:hypothetical protein